MNKARFRDFLKQRGIKQMVGLDFETFYGPGYSLRSTKMSTTEYIRHEQFKAQCIGLQEMDDDEPYWCSPEDIALALDEYDWKTTALLAHNAAFDGLIQSHHYGHIPKYYFCSMSMARPLFSHVIGAGLDEVSKHLGHAGKTRAAALDAVKGTRDLPDELLMPLGRYCADDVSEMWSIFWDMLSMDFPADELDLINLTINAYANPSIYVDRPRARAELDREVKNKFKVIGRVTEMLDVEAKLHKAAEIQAAKHAKNKRCKQPEPVNSDTIYVGTTKILNSNPQFADALLERGVTPPKKISPTTKKPTFAFAKNDLEFQALEQHENDEIKDLYAARLMAKSSIGETRARRLLEHGKKPYKLPLMLNYARAHTFRWSGGDKMNPQNFKRGGELRRSLIAPKGYKIVVVDSSQIEDRTNCRLAGQNDVLDQYRDNQDVYSLLASKIYGFEVIKKEHPKERFVGKVGRLGLGYGMGGDRYQNTLAVGAMGPPVIVTVDEAFKIVKTYRRENQHVVAQWRLFDTMLNVMLNKKEFTYKDIITFHEDGVDLPNGLMLHYPRLRALFDPRREKFTDFTYWNGNYFTEIYGGLFVENVIQALARIIVGEQMLMIAERYQIVTMSHDEVVYLALAAEAERAYQFGLKCLRTEPSWLPGIPLNAEGGYDDNYSK